MKNFATPWLALYFTLMTPFSAFAFLGMNAGATLQGALPAWTQELGNRSLLVNTKGQAVATDPSKNIIVVGSTYGDLDGNTLSGTQNLFVTKYAFGGVKLWTRQVGGPSAYITGSGVATDSSGNIFVAGTVNIGLDGNTLMGSTDFFVIKYDASGAKQWTRQFGTTAKYTNGMSAAIDSSGNVFVAGYTNGGLDGNTVAGYQDFFVTKYDSTGTKQWTRQLGVASANTYGYGVATDSSGNVFVAGRAEGGLDGNTLTGSSDFFVTKYDPSGAKQWTKQLGVSSKTTQANGVTTDSAGNIFVAGYTMGGLDGNTLAGLQDFFVTKYDSSGAKTWTRQLGSTNRYTTATGVATDSSGNISVAGYTNAGLDGNSLTGSYDFFITHYDSTGTKQWTKQLGVVSGSTDAYGVASDSSGNVIATGYTTGGLDGNTLTGSNDFFVSKYDSSGAKQWTKQMGALGPANISATGAASDNSGNLYITGNTNSGLDGNTMTGNGDFFVIKYDSTGAKKWTRQLGATSKYTSSYAVATDSSSNVFAAGVTNGNLDGNTQTGTTDFFVTKYDSTGAKQWTRQLGASASAINTYGVATDLSGNVFVAGYTDTGLDGNTQTGNYDLFVAKYDSSGVKQWVKQLGVASGYVYGRAVTTDSSGNVFVAGYTISNLDGNTKTGTVDFFFTKYNSAGTKQWTKQLGVAASSTYAYGVTTDLSGNIFVTGYTTGGLDGNTLTGANDFFVTKYDSTGTKLWTRQLGVASQNTQANGVTTDPSGNVYVAGYTKGALDGNSLKGTQDFFVTKYTSTGVRQWTKQMGAPLSTANATGIAMHSSGRLYVAGTTTNGIDFNSQVGNLDAFACQYIGN